MFLDANIFIHAFRDREGREAESCRRLLLKVAKGEQHATTSPIVAEEVLHHFMESKSRAFALRALRSISGHPNLAMLAVDEKALMLMPEFVEAGLGSADALHAAVMKANGETTICSFDKGFDSAPGLRRKEP